jgi:hypothetical protein
MAKYKVKLHRDEISKQLLKSDEVRNFVNKVADQVAISAGPEFYVMEEMHRLRFVATVIDPSEDALRREADEGNLTRALSSMGVQRRFGKKR